MTALETDLLIIGAGPAGLSAALSAAQGGAAVLLADLGPGPGGQIWRGAKASDGGESGTLLRGVQRQPNITALYGAQVALSERGPQGGHAVQFSTPQGPRRVLAQKIILASGATERFLPFPGWTLPGVVGAGGLQAMVKSGLDVRGARVLVAGSGPLLLAVAAGMRAAGAEVVGVAEQASPTRLLGFGLAAQRGGKVGEAAKLLWALRGVPYWPATYPVEASGGERLTQVELGGLTRRTLECDWLAAGFGLVPDTRLAALFGCALEGGAVKVGAWQQTSQPGIYAAGELTGIGGVDKARLEGSMAGYTATGQVERLRDLPTQLEQARHFQASLSRSFALRPSLRTLPAAGTLICRCEDVPHAALQACPSWTEAKLQTRCGMGTCQGRVCGPAAETLYGWTFTGVRPPLLPLPLADLLGE
ncbi:NAD(P)/FAD-dependent oxidoreductase [Deinococcus alpinitundrae]|uniref:NAD(P)/FAD-dependent oxidoreductase n=1 Tax=Deinococcus alpinitundrae TaxID=468913 RepID=UPI001379F2FF|nr:FAD/NAD(P)-binding oxidoreductase [Deinococcus alpinitundrae]